MAKKVLVLNGSYMPNGSVDVLLRELERGVKDAGNEAVRLNVTRMTVGGCRGCNACKMGKAHPCVQKDDMDRVYKELESSDVVVWGTPLYFYQMSGAMKTLLDRLYALPQSEEEGKGYATVVAASAPEDDIRECMEPFYERCFEGTLGWTDRGSVFAGGVDGGESAKRSPAFTQAYELGRSLRGGLPGRDPEGCQTLLPPPKPL